jgi:hypothetical protein
MSIVGRVRRDAFLLSKKIYHNFSPVSHDRKLTVFVSGVQRSGTNMFMQLLEKSLKTDVYHESDSRVFDNFIMRELAVVDDCHKKSKAELFVIKALHEGHDLEKLLQHFAPSRAIWAYRDFRDVINSNLRRFRNNDNFIHDIAKDRKSAGWRGLGMTDETWEKLKSYYYSDISYANANALFWWYRNRLFFDHGYFKNKNILLVKYEDLVKSDERIYQKLEGFLNITIKPSMKSFIFQSSLHKNAPPELDATILELCEEMYVRLERAYQSQF